VTVDSGEFPLFRNIDASHQPSRSKVYTAWLKGFEDMVPSALDRLAEVVEVVQGAAHGLVTLPRRGHDRRHGHTRGWGKEGQDLRRKLRRLGRRSAFGHGAP